MKALRINGIVEESIVDGPGLRYVIFVQGCCSNCYMCQNPATHDLNGGYIVGIDELYNEIMENPLLQGVTFSGGEPFLNPRPLIELGKRLKKQGLDVVTYTGFLYEEIQAKGIFDQLELLRITDVLVDGPFVFEERDSSLLFRGSANQRLLFMEEGLICDSLQSQYMR